MRYLNRQHTDSDETIACGAAHDERVQRLRSVPSLGPVIAAAFVATIDDVQRFPHSVIMVRAAVEGERPDQSTEIGAR